MLIVGADGRKSGGQSMHRAPVIKYVDAGAGDLLRCWWKSNLKGGCAVGAALSSLMKCVAAVGASNEPTSVEIESQEHTAA